MIAEQQGKIKANERVQALQARQQEKERLHQLLKHVQINLEHYQTETQKLRLEQEIIVEKQRTDYEQRLLQLQQQIEAVTHKKLFLEAQYAGLNRDYTAALACQNALAKENVQLRQEHITLKANYDTIEQKLSEVSQEFSVQRQALESKSRELLEYQLRLKMAEGKTDSLQKALFVAEDKIMILRDDYLFATQAKANLEGQVKQLVNKETQERVS